MSASDQPGDGDFADTDVERPALDIGYLGEPEWAGALAEPPPADWEPPPPEAPPEPAPAEVPPAPPVDPVEFAETEHHARMYPWKDMEPIRELPENPPPRGRGGGGASTRLPASDTGLKVALGLVIALIALLAITILIGLAVELTAPLEGETVEVEH